LSSKSNSAKVSEQSIVAFVPTYSRMIEKQFKNVMEDYI